MPRSELPPPPASPEASLDPDPLWTVGAAIVLVATVALSIAVPPPLDDFDVFWCAARSVIEAGDPYAVTCRDRGIDAPAYGYPPLLAWLVVPLAHLPRALGSLAWGVGNGIATVGVGATIAALTGSVTVRSTVLWSGVLMSNLHQLQGNTIGQNHNLVALGALGGVALWMRGRSGAAGAAIGAVAAMKLFPALLVVGLVRERAHRGVVAFAAVIAGIASLGLPQHLAYARDQLLSGQTPLPTASQHVMSLPAVGQRLFAPSAHAVPLWDWPLGEALVTGALLLAVGAGVAWVVVRAPDPRHRWAALLLGSLLLSPATGNYHAGLAIAAVVMAHTAGPPPPGGWWRIRRGPGVGWSVVGLVLLWAPVEYGLGDVASGPLLPVRMALHVGLGTLFVSPQLYGLLFALVGVARAAQGQLGASR